MTARSIKFNALMNGLRTVSTLIFPLITFPYTSRVLGPEGTGKINFAWTFVGYFVLIAAIGIPYYGIREIAKVRDDAARLRNVAQELVTLHLGASVLATLAFLAAVLYSGKLAADPWLYLVVSSSIILSAAGMEWLYEGREDYAYITTRSLIFSCLSMAALFLFVHDSGDYVVNAGIGVAASLGSCVMNFWNARGIILAKRTEPWRFRKHFTSIGTIYALGLLSSLYLNADVMFLGFLTSDQQVGIYSAATKLNKLVAMLLASAGAVLMPRLSYYIEKGMNEEYRLMVGKSIAVTLLFSLPCVVGLVLLSREIIAVFAGPQYAQSVHCLVITAPVLLLSSLAGILAWQILYPKGGERQILWASLAGAVVSCGINYGFILQWGYTGAAVALFLSECAVFAFLWWPARADIVPSVVMRNVGRSVVASVAMAAVLLGLLAIGMNDVLRLVLGVSLGALTYFAVLYVLNEPLLMELKAIVLKRFNRVREVL